MFTHRGRRLISCLLMPAASITASMVTLGITHIPRVWCFGYQIHIPRVWCFGSCGVLDIKYISLECGVLVVAEDIRSRVTLDFLTSKADECIEVVVLCPLSLTHTCTHTHTSCIHIHSLSVSQTHTHTNTCTHRGTYSLSA